MVPYLPWIALAQSTDGINMDCNQLSMGLGWSHHIHTTKGQEEQVCTWGARNLQVLSATAVAELAVITDSDTAKSWRSGARLQQLSAAAALATAHCGSPCIVNTASSHSYGGERGGTVQGWPERWWWWEGIAPGEHVLSLARHLGFAQLSGLFLSPLEFLGSPCWQLDCHRIGFRFPLRYSSSLFVSAFMPCF